MKKLKYKITFYSDWHCGSGLAAGADADQLVIKDKDGMPFVPGKTIKGLFHEAVDDYCAFSKECDAKKIDECFGTEDRKGQESQGCLFFSNAHLLETEYNEIVEASASEYLYRRISSTKIGEDGIAEDHSLRSMEVTVPCTVEGEIMNVPDDMVDFIKKSSGLIKRLGLNRNRGLGRCKIEFEKEGK